MPDLGITPRPLACPRTIGSAQMTAADRIPRDYGAGPACRASPPMGMETRLSDNETAMPAGRVAVGDRATWPDVPASSSTGSGLTRADLMTAAQVAELLDVPVSTIREWGRNGTLPRVKLGRHVRFLRAQVENVILSASPRTPVH